ncbi:MAG: OB-fold domain-containing protein [Candidatus Rokubacteria bacterium]|nr:OB-fold domain-containing protein [Candidatus Rokubacteria bacterium]
MTYFRAVDPFPLESPEQTKLHEFYEYLAAGRLVTTACRGCRRRDWPPRGFCPECGSDQFDWSDLPHEGLLHAFTVQETGVPAGFDKPLIFGITRLDELRIFTRIIETEPAELAVGKRVQFTPLRVTDDHEGKPRYLPAFKLVE